MVDSANQQNSKSWKGLIAEDNSKVITTDWQLTYVRFNSYKSENIEGYCSHTGVNVGETLDIFVSASQPTEVSVNIYRMFII